MFAGDAQSGMMERFDVSTIIRFGSDMRSHIAARDRLPQAGTSVPLRSEPCFRCLSEYLITMASGGYRCYICLSPLKAPYTGQHRSEEHTSDIQSLMRSSYDVYCMQK